jgi:hypothetical protein
VCECIGGEQRGRSKRLQSPVERGKVMAMEREYYIRLSGVVVASFHEEQTRY